MINIQNNEIKRECIIQLVHDKIRTPIKLKIDKLKNEINIEYTRVINKYQV